MTDAEKSLSIRIANSVYSYFEHMPGYDETCMPTYGVIYELVVQGMANDMHADAGSRRGDSTAGGEDVGVP